MLSVFLFHLDHQNNYLIWDFTAIDLSLQNKIDNELNTKLPK